MTGLCLWPQHKTVDTQQVRRLVKQQFFLHANETDETKIAKLKKNAMSALTNYVMHISVGCVLFLFHYCAKPPCVPVFARLCQLIWIVLPFGDITIIDLYDCSLVSLKCCQHFKGLVVSPY